MATSLLGAATSALTRSSLRYRSGVSGDISDCSVGITLPMCNRVTNHGDMGTFSKPREEQFGFRQGRGCMDQVFAVRQVCEKYLANGKDVL